ncbi:MAG: ABC transporter substrate-binding protein [Chloroflexi bacterium HGW-Chloroflexi-10]|nr:MAG: ABC transporter substrate-binding protein [Chloroflexi bacterium HGW-Chloroflexi-10]
MKKVLSILIVVLIISFSLVACQPAEPQVITEKVIETVEVEVTKQVEVVKEVATEPVTIRLSGWAANPQETALLESILYKFSVAYPDIRVKYEPITGDYLQAINTMVATGEEPDVYYLDIAQYPRFVENGVLAPLNDYMTSSGVKTSDFIPSLMDAFTTDGVVYGIPKDFNSLGMFYNKTLFDNAELDYPTNDWTWDDLKVAAEKITDVENNIFGFGVPADAGRFPTFIFQNGGSVMSEDFSETLLDSPEAVAAAEFYTNFRVNSYGATPDQVGEGWQGTAFGKGNFAMVYEGGWLIPYLREQFPGIEYGVVNPPAGPAGEGNMVFTVAYVLSPNSKNPEAAWELINFLTNEQSQTTVLESGFALPTRVVLGESEYLKNNSASAAIFNGAFEGAKPFVWGIVGSDVNDQMGKALERVYLENQNVADSFKLAAEAIRKAIAEQ